MSMDIKQIQDLIKFVSKSGVNEVSIEEKDFKITIKTNQEPTYVTAALPTVNPTVMPSPVAASTPETKPTQQAPGVESSTKTEDSHLLTIKSPMIGTFYRSPGPDQAAFVNVGDDISTGKVICIVEAMKLFNEIESEVSGKIVKILVNDAEPVEYDQPLFLVDPR